MTDKKMAEESLISYRKEPKWAGKMFMQDENTIYKDGFLAGLKAGRPEWHKVADGDLPKENKLYFVAIKDNGLAIAYFNGRHWETKFNLGDFGHCVETVIAWCEIPKYTEE